MRLPKQLIIFSLCLLLLSEPTQTWGMGTSPTTEPPAPVPAQQPPTPAPQGDQVGAFQPSVRFSHLTSDDGLPQNAIETFYQDSRGFMWIGTPDGLSRFDGYQFTTYKHDPTNSKSLNHNYTFALYEDRDGMIWVGTRGVGGLSRFDPTTESFTRYTHRPDDPNTVGGNSVSTIFQDHQGTFWFGGPPWSGLTSLTFAPPESDAKDTTELRPQFTRRYPDPKNPQSFQGGIWQIQADTENRLWLASDGALVKVGADAKSFTNYKIPNPQEQRIEALLQDQDGNWWVGGQTGLYKFDPRTERFTNFPEGPQHVDSLVKTADGFFWVGTDYGLFRFDPRTGQSSTPLLPDPANPHSLSDREVTALFVDKAGVLWVGTANGGINLLDPRHARFAHYQHSPSQPQGLTAGAIDALTGGDDGFLWVATQNTVNQIDLASGQIRHLPLPDEDGRGTSISVLSRDRSNRLWVGVNDHVVYAFDVASQKFTPYPLPSEWAGPGPRPPSNVSAIHEDQQGNLWVGVLRGGLYRLDPTHRDIQRYKPTSSVLAPGGAAPAPTTTTPETIVNELVTAVTSDQSGHLWVGYETGALSRFDHQTGTFHHYMPKLDQPQTNLGGTIYTILEGRDGNLWLATRIGLLRFDPTTAEVKRYTDHDGLPSSFITGVIEDEQGHLWLSTKKGIARFDPATERFRNYDAQDGLQGNEFNPYTHWQAPDGRLFFGGSNGITAFDPTQIRDDPYTPPVVLTAFRLFNEPVPVGPDTLLPQTLWATEELTLNYDQNILSFEFAALSFAASGKNRYRYKLEGLEHSWNEVDSRRRFANYTSLPAGSYTLRVQGSNADGVWSNQEVALRLTILPPWWETMWFRALVLGVAVLALYGGYRWRVHAIEQQNRSLEAEVVTRTRDLAESEARFRGLATSTFEAVLIHDQGQILDANQAAQALFGYAHEEILGRELGEMLQPESRGVLAQQWHAPISDAYEVMGRTRMGAAVPLEVRDRVVPYGGRMVRVAAMRDLTERRQIEAQKEHLAAITERERIGRELHDDLGQVMGYVNVQAQAIQILLNQGHLERVQNTLAQLIGVAQKAHEDVRHYILGIRTGATPVQEDFLAALDHHLKHLQTYYGFETEVSWPNDLTDSPLSTEAESQLLRIIQESLANARRHGKVSQARLTFTLLPQALQIKIADEGQGFQANGGTNGQRDKPSHKLSKTPQGAQLQGHFGLNIMRERAESVGGQLEIHSTPGQGTEVVVQLPLASAPPVANMASEMRVLLVDDHPLYMEGLQTMLTAQGITIVGTARDGLEAQHLANTLHPNLILMDIEMPRCNGLEATRQIKAAHPEIKVVVLTVAADEELLFQALQHGASGYLLKNLDGPQLFAMLNDVMRGEVVFSPALASHALRELTGQTHSSSANMTEDDSAALTRLSPHQQVLGLIAEGQNNAAVAATLGLTETTVKQHLRQVLDRLQQQHSPNNEPSSATTTNASPPSARG